ncbi:MAG TPA: zinc-binding dehydrogenase [Candidatus Thermoplasmatota archaeon]
MDAVIHRAHGGLDQLELAAVPEPTAPGDGVRLRVAACGLNHLDLWTLQGIEGVTIPLPHIPGSDIAGTVDSVGPRASGWKEGDRVVVNPSLWCGACEFCRRGDINYCTRYGIIGEHIDGGMAQYFACAEKHLLKVPEGFPLEVAAAAALVYQTAWRMVAVRGGLRAGQWVLVNGAGGGVASAAVQIAKLHGAHVVATTSTPDKERSVRALGADYVLNYRTQEVDREVFKITGKRGVDLVVDSVGKDAWRANLRALARGGRLVTCGATTGNNPEAMVHLLFWKQLTVHGSTMGNWHDFENVMRLVFQGRLRPVVDRVLPMRDFRDAFARLAAGEQFGKVVLAP